MLGISRRTTAEATSSPPTTSQGESATWREEPTRPAASHSLARECASPWASESEAAITKKLLQPTSCSNCRQLITPMPGARKQIHASSAGMVGCRWWTASVSHSRPAPPVMSRVRHSAPESGRGAAVSGTVMRARKPGR